MSNPGIILSNEIKQAIIDLKSDKASLRSKGLDNIQQLIDNRSNDIDSILRSNHEDYITWSTLYSELHETIREQCLRLESCRSGSSLTTLKNKNDAYKSIFTKCINLANQHNSNVPLRRICETAFECFSNTIFRTYFDGCYLKIINKHVLCTKFNLDSLEVSDWSKLLSFVFDLFENSDIPKLELLQSLPPLLKHSSHYTYLLSDLQQYLPNLLNIVNDNSHQFKAQKQLMLTVFEFICCMGLSQRKTIVQFTEQILDKLLKMYQESMEPGTKEILFKVLHTSIIIHSPQTDKSQVEYNNGDALFEVNVANDKNLWHKHLRTMFTIVDREIKNARKQSSRLNQKLEICDKFVQMAAKLCSVIYWNESVWMVVIDGQAQKKRRQIMKLERILELVEHESQKFCWRWFVIMSEMLSKFPHLLDVDDYQPLLNLLSEYQPNIQHSIQMKAFNQIVRTMLSVESKLKAAPSSPITDQFCVQHWNKIMEFAFKQAETDKNQAENLDLIGIFAEYHTIGSHEFIKTVITDITKLSNIRKSNNSIALLISIYRNINTEAIDGINDLKINTIAWLSSKVSATDLKRLLNNNNCLDKRLIAELYAICSLCRTGDGNEFVKKKFKNQKNDIQDEYRTMILDLEKGLHYRTLLNLIVVDLKKNPSEHSTDTKLPARNKLKANINEAINAKMEESLHSDDNFGNSIEDFNIICSSLATYANILNFFIEYEAIDEDSLNASNLKKRIPIRMHQLNKIVEQFSSSLNAEREPNDVNEIVEHLLSVWNNGFHSVVNEIIFSWDNKAIIEWLKRQLNSSSRVPSLIMTPFKHANEMDFNYRIQLKCLTLLAHFSAWDNDSDGMDLTFYAIQDYDFDYERNEDLYMTLELAKIILNQRSPSQSRVDWAMDQLMSISSDYVKNQNYMELVADHLPALIKSVAPYAEMHDNLINLLSAFLMQVRKKKYGQQIAIKVIKSTQYFAQQFFQDEDCFKILTILSKFLNSEYLLIQLTTVECLTNIFNKDWLCPDPESVDCVFLQDFHTKLLEKLNINQIQLNSDDGIDRKTCVLSTRLQLYCSIIGSCFVLRQEMWFKFIAMRCIPELDDQLRGEKIFEIASKLCSEIFKMKPAAILEEYMPYLIERFVIKNYKLALFPWQLIDCQSNDEFIFKYTENIALSIIIYNPALIPETVKSLSMKSFGDLLTMENVVKCLAFATPINLTEQINSERKKHVIKLVAMLRKEKPQLDDYFRDVSLKIAEEMLNAMWDIGKFNEFFDMNVEYVINETTIDYKVFIKSLDYIQERAGRKTHIMNHFCQHEPVAVINMLNSMKLSMQKAVCDELKLHQMFRICILIELITKFLVKNAKITNQSATVAFFIRDFVHFFGNIISNAATDKLKLAACNYFQKFIAEILSSCAEHFQTYLNYIVSILMPITKKGSTKVICTSMKLLEFLIVEQQHVLNMTIGLLDSFPAQSEFDKLRQIQNQSKYEGKTFSLLDEMECFLLVEKRKAEGLLSLKEHLSTKKVELKSIYEHIYDSRGFSEDCDKSIIHRLIFTLLQTVQGVDKERSILAAKCLAELGPGDLGTMVLKFDIQTRNYEVCKSFEAAIGNLCDCVLEKLNGYFAHSNANVLIAISKAAYELLKSQKANQFIDKYPLLNVFKSIPTIDLPIQQTVQDLELSKWFTIDNFNSTHSNWIKNIAIELFTWFDCAYLAEVAAMQAQFTEAVVPLLIKAILVTKVKSHLKDINDSVNLFFANHFTKHDQSNENPPVFMNKLSIKLMLNIAECIRIHNQNSSIGNHLTINYYHIAKAASFCNAHFTSILYSELALAGETTETSGIKSIIKTAYRSIGQTDAALAFLDPIQERVEYFEMRQNWNAMFSILNPNIMTDIPLLNRYLGQAGLYGLANKLSQNMNTANYECAWRLSDWSIINNGSGNDISTNPSIEFDKHHYFALKCLHEKQESGVRFNIERAIDEVIKTMKQSSYECTKNIYKELMKLQMLQQIEEFCELEFQRSNPELIIKKWKYQDDVPMAEFNCREQVLAQRIVILKTAGVRALRKIKIFDEQFSKNGIQQMILDLGSECREEGHHNLCRGYLSTLKTMQLSKDMKAKMMLEDAKLTWMDEDFIQTKCLIERVKDELIVSMTPVIALSMYGEYLAEHRAENIKTIKELYLDKSTTMSTQYKKNMHKFENNSEYYRPPEICNKLHSDNEKRNYRIIAKYADREYQQIAAYKNSAEFEKKQSNVNKFRRTLDSLESKKTNLTADDKRSRHTMIKSVEIDEKDIESTNNEYEFYLELTIEHYLKCLLLESDNETDCFVMFRIFALQLANQLNATILNKIQQNVGKIPSYKFIEVVPQLMAHLNTSNDGLGRLVHDIILRCAMEHPHHVIIKVLALANAYKDSEQGGNVRSASISLTPRTDGSKIILDQLRKHSKLRVIVEQMELMCNALIVLANKDYSKVKKVLLPNEPLLKLKNLDKIQCPTIKLNVSPTGDYSKIISISHWLPQFMCPGGINAPKKMECICSDGKRYSQLVKGRDDPRQDAVMQQVFNIVNRMLAQSKTTKRDRLNIRTYVVIPLSQKSGILEWCSNTMTLAEYLIGDKGAHVRYRPNDIHPNEARSSYAKIDRNYPNSQRLKNYLAVCEKIHPVFHHFFLEHFYNPGVWFERRMAYAHSLATTSMIGYVMGIGDRHISNILIDKTTAELIHIDFGIAFEQGKILPTPELIPFRLTRDLISALGASGVEGVFRKSCEKSMEVLRQHKSTILTIVEVLLHDPLNVWSLTSSEAARRQETDIQIDEQDVNGMAERALIRVEEKLDGKHISRSDSLNVQRHVEVLIQEATNVNNLSTLFVGWQPYL